MSRESKPEPPMSEPTSDPRDLIAKWRAESDEIDADGDFCCALTRRHDANELESALASSRALQPQSVDKEDVKLDLAYFTKLTPMELIKESAYCHHRHHFDQHSSDFSTCSHPICVNVRAARFSFPAMPQTDTASLSPQIACPVCGEVVKQVASATLDLALWQHYNWVCPKRASLSPSSPQAWEPIETAPKGGFPEGFTGELLTTDPAWVDPPRILVTKADGDLAIVYWDWYYAEGGNGFEVNKTAWAGDADEEPLCKPPQCWMPLPPAPGEARKD